MMHALLHQNPKNIFLKKEKPIGFEPIYLCWWEQKDWKQILKT